MIGENLSRRCTNNRIFRYILIHVCISTNKSVIANSYPADNDGTSPYYHIVTNGRTSPWQRPAYPRVTLWKILQFLPILILPITIPQKCSNLNPSPISAPRESWIPRLPTDMLIIKGEQSLSHRYLRPDMIPLMIQPM